MDDDTKQRIIEAYWSLPEDLRQSPATEQQLRAFEAAFGPIPPDYRWFLRTCGGGVVGSERIDGIDELVASALEC